MAIAHLVQPIKSLGFTAVVLWMAGCQQLGSLAQNRGLQPDFVGKVFGSPKASSTREQSSKAEAQMALARSLERSGRTEEAIQAYYRILSQEHRADAFHRLAVLHDKKGNYQESAEHYRSALRHAPKNPEIHCDLGYSYYVQGRLDEAKAQLSKAVSFGPKLARAHNNMGLVLARMGHYDDALGQFMAAGCEEPEARVNLAFALMIDEEIDEARSQVELAIRAKTTLQPARQLLAVIDQEYGSAAKSPQLEQAPGSVEQAARSEDGRVNPFDAVRSAAVVERGHVRDATVKPAEEMDRGVAATDARDLFSRLQQREPLQVEEGLTQNDRNVLGLAARENRSRQIVSKGTPPAPSDSGSGVAPTKESVAQTQGGVEWESSRKSSRTVAAANQTGAPEGMIVSAPASRSDKEKLDETLRVRSLSELSRAQIEPTTKLTPRTNPGVPQDQLLGDQSCGRHEESAARCSAVLEATAPCRTRAPEETESSMPKANLNPVVTGPRIFHSASQTSPRSLPTERPEPATSATTMKATENMLRKPSYRPGDANPMRM